MRDGRWGQRGSCGAWVLLALLAGTANAVNIETVPVGNPGNAADMRYNLDRRPEGYGRVDYDYRIGKYEVTAGPSSATRTGSGR